MVTAYVYQQHYRLGTGSDTVQSFTGLTWLAIAQQVQLNVQKCSLIIQTLQLLKHPFHHP